MKNVPLYKRALSTILAVALLFTLLVPAVSAENGAAKSSAAKKTVEATKSQVLSLTPIDAGTLESRKLNKASEESAEQAAYQPTDVVRVSIELSKASTIDAGFEIEGIAANLQAKAYRESLKADQNKMIQKIESILDKQIDVKWNLTLAANIISANVAYGDIEKIAAIDGVSSVFLENRYEPEKTVETDEPNNGSASHMIGSNLVWAAGYTGAGSKVAVIDTGIDVDHLSFSGEALEYALAKNAEAKNMSYDEYVESLDLLTADKIDALKDQLNANVGSGEAAHRSTKIAYGYNYVDNDVSYIDHMQDSQGEHGSHVEGISAANRYVKVGDEFEDALDAVGTQGVAPDAQIVTMKVFGKGGGAYDSDYMVAIEDAIILGCDSANLSLGSGNPGMSFSGSYEDIMNKLVANGTVVSFSAGNSSMWYSTPKNDDMYGYLYLDDNNFQTDGSPGSFTNALTVASVDNVGQTGKPLMFGDLHVFYTETNGYGNKPIATLAGPDPVQYILFDNVGADADGNSLLTPYADAIAGKVVLCSRGTSSFYQKVNAAAAAGAIGCIIYNNQTGTISMNLTGLTTDIPAVSITRADGDAIRAQSEPTADESGAPLYYTGTFSVGTELEINIPEEMSDIVTVSDFSSWGTPGSLVLKPEILAPGGSIYSVWGANTGDSSPTTSHEDYELMSGTSMASPQVNGMAGLLGQYIRENGLTAKTGLSQRQLINSLLMSTAHPVYEDYGDYGGGYWPVIRVGAGLANVADAVNAKSYILMGEDSTIMPDTAKDGKVKAELGDDPERTGKYTYSFTINPLDDKDKQFTLQTDIFTQDVAGNAGYGLLLDTWTWLLDAELTYEVNGETYKVVSERDADVNGDGETNAADAQAILDYLTDKLGEEEEFDSEAADADFDGMITSKDAYVILESMSTALITAPAGEATEVKVTIQLTDAYREYLDLDYLYTGGAYIEGYTYVIPYSTEEGEITDVVHSIPILAYYGSWTDASMLDRDSVIENAYGIGKLPYLGNSNTNYMTVKDENGASSIYMGNPYTVEDEFPAERLALKSSDTIASFNYINIRNAATLGFAVQNEDGEVLFAQSSATNKFSAYYYVNGGTWQNTSPSTYNVGKTLSSAGVKEGDKVTVGFYALPEYYGIVDAKANGEVATTGSLDNEGFKRALTSAMLGDGAGIKYAVTIDDTAPVVTGAMRDLITGDITVTASDNNYVAYIGILNKTGSRVFAETVPEQTEPGQTVTVPVDLEGQTLPSEVVLLVGDYAGNEVAYKIQLGGEAEDLGGTMIGFVNASTTAAPGSGNRAWQIDADALWYNYSAGTYEGLSVFTQMGVGVLAAEYVDGYVFIAGDDGWLYAGKFEELDSVARVARYDDVTDVIYDMAFNYANKKLYALGEDNVLYKIDLLTGELTEVAEITLGDTTGIANALAIDDGGTFYTASEGSSSYSILYKFRLDGSGGSTPEPEPEPEGNVVYQWDFEEDPDDTDWTFVDSDGDGYNWAWNQKITSWFSSTPDFDSMANNGVGCIVSGSYINTVGALTPDNWAISPAVSLSEATTATLGFYFSSIDPNYPDKVTVYAGTSADPDDMEAVSGAITSPSSESYVQHVVDLSDYAGEDTVYIAFRNTGTYDQYLCAIDDVTIYADGYGVGSVSGPSRAVNPARHATRPASFAQPTKSGEPAVAAALPAEPAEETEEAKLTFSFETLEEFNTWTNVDADGDGNVWYRLTTGDNSALEPKDGEAFATSASYNGAVLTPDNWFVSPPMDFSAVTAEASLSVWAQAQDASWPAETFALYAGTTNNPDEMTMVSGPYTLTAGAQGPKGAAGSWYQYTADLSAYAGEEQVFVAIRHYDTTDMFRMNIDLVQIFADGEISTTEPVAPPDPPEPPAPVEGLVAGYYFESASDVDAWTHVNNGEADWIWSGNNLGGYDYAPLAHEGSGFMMAYSFVDDQGALQADCWAISPAVTLPANAEAQLSFYATNANAEYPEPFSVYVGTSADPAEMTALATNLSPTTGYDDAWTRYTYDLSDYAGQTVYVGFYDYNYDGYEIWIDQVEITSGGSVGPEPEEFQEITATAVGDGIGAYNYSNGGGMAWDHNKGVLYLVSNYNSTQDYDHYLWIVDTATGVGARANNNGTGTGSSNTAARLYGAVNGLFIIPGGGTLIPDADEAIAVSADPAELNLLKGQTVRLNVLISPWNLEDKGFTLEAADPTIVSVNDKGEVTALAVGETTVTATTNASPNLTVEVPVTVTEPPVAELRGVIWDEGGKGMASVFNTDDTNNWEGLAKVGALRWGALVGDTVYGSTEDTMYVFDADTYEVTTLGGIVSDWIPSDAEELPQDFRDAFAAMGYSVGPVIGTTTGGVYLTMLDPVKGSLIYFNLSDTVFGEDPMATIAYVGRGEYDDGDSTDDNAAIYYVLTESGALYAFTLNHAGSVTWKLLGNTGIDLSGVSDVTNEIWASMTYNADAEFLYLSLYNGSDNNAHLYAIDANDPAVNGECGTFNDGVWPVVGLYQYTPATDLTLKVEPASVSIYEGTTAQLNIKVKLGETNKFTVVSADETVATVDETGLITGVAKGETTVTVTTVDKNAAGEQLKVEVPVSVDGLVHPEIALTAQITDDEGASFAKLNLEDMTYEKLADAPFDADFGTRAGEIYVAGDASLMTALAYEDLTTPADYDYDTETYARYPVLDIANFPEYYDLRGNLKSEKTLMVLEAGYLVDPQYSGWSLGSLITDMVAVCYAGENVVETEEETPYYTYLILNAAGELYSMGINFEEGIRTAPEKIFETGITFEDLHDASMTYIEDVEIDAETGEMTGTAGVVIADNTSNCIWFVDFLAEEVGLVGTYEASNVTGLVGTYDAQKAQLSAHADPFDPGPEPTDPGTYPEVNTELKGLKVRFDFETDPDEDGWTFFDRDNDGNGWEKTTDASYAYEGTGALQSDSYRSGTGALKPDNFAITPAIDLSASQDANFSVFARDTSSYYTGDVFAFYAGTTPNVSEMTKISPDFAAGASWAQYTASLKDFAGQSTVYVAIRHYNCTNIYGLLVDNATVFTDDAEPEPEPEIGLSFSFETSQEVALWTMVNLDDDNKTWSQYSLSGTLPDGSKVLYSTYNASAAVDDLAISPALDLSELTAAQLSFWVKRGLSNYMENYAVYVGTTPEFSEMTEIIPETEAPTEWTNVTYDLSDYAGQEGVYVAFRHTAIADQYNIYLDLVEIVDPNAAGTGAKPAPAQTANEKKTVPAKITVRDLLDKMAPRLACGEGRLDRKPAAVTDKMTSLGEAVNAANGGTNAAKNGKFGNRPSFDLMGLEGEAADNTVTLELTEDVAVNNGLLYVFYDPELLTFVSLDSGFTYKSYTDDADHGYVTFAFADSEAVAAGDLLAKLTFSYENGCVDTTVTVVTEELNNNLFYLRSEEVDLYDVTYGEPEWSWNEDYTEASATFTSLDGLTSETVEAIVGEPEHADPDCTNKGFDKYTATAEFNGETYTDVQTVEIDALGHKPITLPGVEPTCTSTGLTEGSKCSVCGEVLVEQEIVEALGHTPEAIPAVAPTCTATGLTEGSRCSVCGEILTAQETVAAKGHAWNAGEIVAAATCTTDGVKVFTCTVCGDQRVEAINKTGHQATNVAAIAATCTTSGVTAGTKCAVCGAILSGCEPVPAKGHTIVTIPAVAATCTATGMSEGAKCSVCNEVIVAPKQTPKAAHTIVSIPAVAATCTAGGKTEGFKCSVCNEVIVAQKDTEALGHSYGAGEVTTAPTTAAEGVMTYTCSRCGDKKTESIAKLNGLGLELFLALLKDVDTALYTDETAAAFTAAVEAAKKALTEAKSQAELDDALADLLNAFNALEEKPFLFDDVKDSSAFYFDPVYWAYYHEPQITTGTSATEFSPDNPVTRGQAMTFLWRSAGEPKASNPTNPFEDVKEGAFYYDAVLWAVEKGITTGTSATRFSPNGTCTKGHIITFIWRWLGQPAATGSNPFTDVEESNFYYTAAIWANENGLVDEATGVTATAFNAKETCTRGQTVTFLYRASAED